jgi:CspA family cold shock protein
MAQGVIKRLVADRGFGFISAPGGDVFFHHSAVVDASFDDLEEGQTVEYEIDDQGGSGGKRGKGPRAGRVKPV